MTLSKVNLTRASRELFRRTPDERFETFDALLTHCQERKFQAIEHWQPSQNLRIERDAGQLLMRLEQAEDVRLSLSDWSFSQLCRLCEVHKETVNKLTTETAELVFRDVMPAFRKPLQAAIDHRPLDAMRALLNRLLGHANQNRLRQRAGRDIDLHLDRQRVDTQ